MPDWKDKPTETGYWWFLRDGEMSRPEIVWYAASNDHVFHHGEEETTPLADDDPGRWLGPINPPDDRSAQTATSTATPLRRFEMTTGSINYPTRFDADLNRAIQAVYKRYGNNLSAFFEDARRARAAEERAYEPDASAERERLESGVIEAAKAEHAAIETYQANSTMENWNAIAPTYDKRKAAVRALIDFESSQIKK